MHAKENSVRRMGRVMRRMRDALLGALLIIMCPAGALAQLTCSLTQITNSPCDPLPGPFGCAHVNFSPSLSADGIRVAFSSTGDLTGGNADGNQEIFLFGANTNAITQLTHTIVTGNFGPSADASGTRIAFVSTSDLTGGNAALNFEIFLFDANTNVFTQITTTTGGGNFNPSINADGTRIAFQSFDNPTGGNPDGNAEIFLFATNTTKRTQITHSTVRDNGSPSISADGTLIAFATENDLTGGNPDGNSEIFLADANTSAITQITKSIGGGNFGPEISADGTRIAFASFNNLTGGNADGNLEVFLFNAKTSAITQITNSTGGGSEDLSISANGTRIAFASENNLTGGNADGNSEIFVFDANTNTFTQITNSSGGDLQNRFPSISADGTRIAFASDRDLTVTLTATPRYFFRNACPLRSLSGAATLGFRTCLYPAAVRSRIASFSVRQAPAHRRERSRSARVRPGFPEPRVASSEGPPFPAAFRRAKSIKETEIMFMLDQKSRPTPDAVDTELDTNELVLLYLESKTYYRLEGPCGVDRPGSAWLELM